MSYDFSNSKILVIGDLMLDIFYYGKSFRESPEAPVPVIEDADIRNILGGALNVANNIKNLGGNVSIIGMLGEDEEAQIINDLLEKENISNTSIIKNKNFKTISKKRIFSNNIQIARIDKEDQNYKFNFTDKDISLIEKQISSCDVLILSDYNKGFLSKDLIPIIIDIARSNNVKIIVDPKKLNFASYKGASIITPNLKEIQDATGITITNQKHLIDICKKIVNEYDFEHIVATKSEDGISIISKTEDHHIDGKLVNNPDVSGAGDTVIATLALGLSVGLDIYSSTNIANIAAGLVVAKEGTSVVSISELKENI
tara:strand:+ start:444 stop:1385 length:942 start_codon:yes stop_codon:yes gene_type:complete